MKKGTMVIWLIIFGIIALVIFQNQAFFLAKTKFVLNLGVQKYSIPPLYNAVVLLLFFFFGLSIAFLFSVSARFKAKRTVKKLNTTIAGHINEVTELKNEINKLKGLETPIDEKADTVKLDMTTTTQQITENSETDPPEDKTIKFDAGADSSNPTDDKEEESDEKKK